MNTLAIMGLPGGSEVILIIFIIMILFGAKKLPELSRSLGKSLGEFRKGQQEGNTPDSVEEAKDATSSEDDDEKSA